MAAVQIACVQLEELSAERDAKEKAALGHVDALNRQRSLLREGLCWARLQAARSAHMPNAAAAALSLPLSMISINMRKD
jgi:hypothetical protein